MWHSTAFQMRNCAMKPDPLAGHLEQRSLSGTRSLRLMSAAAKSLPFAPVIAHPCQHLADRRRRSTSVCAVAACNWRAVGCGWANRGSREAVAPALCSTSRAGDALGRRPAVLRTSSSNRTLCALWCEGTDCRLGSGVGSRMPALPGEIRLGSS